MDYQLHISVKGVQYCMLIGVDIHMWCLHFRHLNRNDRCGFYLPLSYLSRINIMQHLTFVYKDVLIQVIYISDVTLISLM